MDKNILKSVVTDNQVEVPKYQVIPRNFTFEEFDNYVFVGIRRTGKSFLRILFKKLAESVKQPMSFTRVAHIVSSTGVKVGKTTIINYIEYAKDAWLISSIQNIAGKLVDKVCYSLDNSDGTFDREVNALLKLANVLDCKKLVIITCDSEQILETDYKTIEIVPVWKWLLNL